MSDNKTAKKAKLSYKGRPLVRSGNVIYLGDAADEFVAMLTVLATQEQAGLQVATKVLVQIVSTDTSLAPNARIAKRAEKAGLYEAISIASIWLERMCAQ